MGFGVTSKSSGGGNLDQIVDGQVYRRVAGVDSAGKISGASIGSAVVTGSHIAFSTIQDVHIRYNSIQNFHMTTGAISSDNIQYGAIYPIHLTPEVRETILEDAVLQSGNLGFGIVGSTAIAYSAIQSYHLSSNVIAASNLMFGCVQASAIASSVIKTSHIGASQITYDKTVGWSGNFTIGTKTYFVSNGLIVAAMG